MSLVADRRPPLSYVALAPRPADVDLSPVTGITRDHWLDYADDLLLAVRAYRTPDGERYDLPGRPSWQGVRSDGLEAFARTFLLAAFRVAGGGADPHGHLPRYLEGILAGTSAHRGRHARWDAIGGIGRGGQGMVEAASIALGLRLTRSHIWDRLDAGEQDQVEEWLIPALLNEPAPNNWYLFPLTVAGFLESVGRATRETRNAISRGLALLDHWYRGEGWYSDGDGRAFDHYIGWAMHFYPVLHAWLGDDETTDLLRSRLRAFLDSFALTFDRNGAPMHVGRSLTYRFAAATPVAMGAVVDASPLRPGDARRLVSSALQYFDRHGGRHGGLLTLGWHGPHEASVQRYSGPGSPYWASKAFVALLAPAGDPFWTDRETEASSSDAVVSVRTAGYLIQRTALDGIVRLHNHGSDGMATSAADNGPSDPLYARLGYSTRTGPTAPGNPPDNDLAIEFEGVWSSRRRIHPAGSGEDWVASWHYPRFSYSAELEEHTVASGFHDLAGARILTATIARGRLEVRAARLLGVPAGTRLRLSGWALAADDPAELSAEVQSTRVHLHRRSREPLVSQLAGVVGWSSGRIVTAPAGTAFGAWARLPQLHGVADDTGLLVAVASLTAQSPAASPESLLEIRVEAFAVSVLWPDGHRSTVDLERLALSRTEGG